MRVQTVIKCCYLLCYTYFIAFLLVAKINEIFIKLHRNEEGSILKYPSLLHTNYDIRSH